MAAPSIEEAQLIVEFRKRVCDVLNSDSENEDPFLLRWMRARELDLDKAEDMLRNSKKWREEYNVDRVLEVQFDSFFTSEYPFYVRGLDKHGQPITFIPIGKWDLRKLTQGKTEEFKSYVSYLFENVLKGIRNRNLQRKKGLYPLTQTTVIVDWGGYSYMQLLNIKAVQNLLSVGSVYEAHYPEILFRAYFINCPSFFNILLALIKPILAPKTFAKISCHRNDRTEWEQAMKDNVSSDQLTISLGF